MLIYQGEVSGDAQRLPGEAQPAQKSVSEGNPHRRWTLSVPTPFGGFFVVLRLGKERRSKERLRSEGDRSPAKISFVYTFLFWNIVCLIGLGIMVSAYFVKSTLGIDLFQSKSFMHDFVYPPTC